MRRFINKTLGLADNNLPYLQDEWTEKDQLMAEKAEKNGGWLSVSDIQDELMEIFNGDGRGAKNNPF